jgi:hypothetical protein
MTSFAVVGALAAGRPSTNSMSVVRPQVAINRFRRGSAVLIGEDDRVLHAIRPRALAAGVRFRVHQEGEVTEFLDRAGPRAQKWRAGNPRKLLVRLDDGLKIHRDRRVPCIFRRACGVSSNDERVSASIEPPQQHAVLCPSASNERDVL